MSLVPKIVVYLVTLAALAHVRADDDVEGMSVKDVAEALKSFSTECEPQPEEEHIIEVIKFVEDAQYPSKCFRYCLMHQFDFIQEGSTVMNKETVVDMLSSMFSDRRDDLEAIMEDCNNKNQAITDKCENAHAHGICLWNQMKERNFDIPELIDD